MQQNMHFQGVRFFRLLQFEQLSVLRPPTHLNPNVVRIIKSAQNNGLSLMCELILLSEHTSITNSENVLDLLKILEFFMIFRNCLLPHYYMSWFININVTVNCPGKPTCQASFPGNFQVYLNDAQ